MPYLVFFNKVLCEFCSVCSDWHISIQFSQARMCQFRGQGRGRAREGGMDALLGIF